MRGVQLSVIEQGERMVPRMMGQNASDLLKRWCESKGVMVYTGIGVNAIEANGVVLENGTHIGADLASSTVEATIDLASVDTNNPDRDAHLRSPDFFDAKRFPTAKFVSTGIKSDKNGYVVTGDLTLHGWVYDIKTGEVQAYDEERAVFASVEERYASEMASLAASDNCAA